LEISKVAVIGAGEMGHGIAELFAIKGYEVQLMDKFPEALEKAKAGMTSSLSRLVDRGRLTKAESDAALSRVVFAVEIRKAVEKAGLVIEAVPEVPELKRAVLEEVEEAAPRDAILASNTSSIRISELSEGLSRPEKLVGMHFFNPPITMKLVEIIPGERTDTAIVDELAALCSKLGKTPVRVLRDSPGFIVDRVNAAELLFFCLVLDRGIATPAEVDTYARSQGMAMGPYELLDFVGIDVAQDSLSYFSRTLSQEYGSGRSFARKVQAGELGKKTGRGFYEWSSGKARIPEATPTDKITIMDVFAIEINESIKLIEEGVAEPDDVEKGVTLGMSRPFGPITVAKSLSNSEVKSKLDELATKFQCKIFSPTKSIAEGRMREAIEGRQSLNKTRVDETTGPRSTTTAEGTVKNESVYMEKIGGKVARIVLSRPKQNTINNDTLDGLDRIIGELWNDKDVNVVIITGEGDVFSAGADLSQFFANQLAFIEYSRKGQRVFTRLIELPKVTIAVIKGYALGGGLELAMSCDLRMATEDAKLGFPEITRGLVPGWSGTQRITKLVGLSHASSLVLTGEMISGRKAFEIGLVNKLIPSGSTDEFAIAYGKELATAVAPVAVMLAKGLLENGGEVPSEAGLKMESTALGILFDTKDLREGISAFLGKRKPEYEGK
jgi:enoyl-CoA hydratase/3-hydroxyacyl-CoA dehydrogenase